MKPAITFYRAGEAWLRRLPNEVREDNRTVSDNTVRVYNQGFRRAKKILGDMTLDVINNETIRDYIAAMRADGYSPATICGDLIVVKLVIESITRNGDPVFPLVIKRKFARVPRVNKKEQNRPRASRDDIERALQHPELVGPIAIAAGAGLRISEILALRVGDCSDSDCWDDSRSVIHIRRTRKTLSAERSIPVPAELNSFLRRIVGDKARGELLFSLSLNRLYNLLESRDLPPPHAYRRFFSRVREQAGMNANVLKVIMGHSLGDDLTAWYAEVGEDGDFVRAEMERCPLGFTLPPFAAPQSVVWQEVIERTA